MMINKQTTWLTHPVYFVFNYYIILYILGYEQKGFKGKVGDPKIDIRKAFSLVKISIIKYS